MHLCKDYLSMHKQKIRWHVKSSSFYSIYAWNTMYLIPEN